MQSFKDFHKTGKHKNPIQKQKQAAGKFDRKQFIKELYSPDPKKKLITREDVKNYKIFEANKEDAHKAVVKAHFLNALKQPEESTAIITRFFQK